VTKRDEQRIDRAHLFDFIGQLHHVSIVKRENEMVKRNGQVDFRIDSFQRECLSVHVGQAGVQIGNACWELSVKRDLCCNAQSMQF
jgi:hypothetical protein